MDDFRIYIGNLPYVAQQRDVEALFASNNITFTNLDISIDPFTGRNPSYCFVDLQCADDVQFAMDVLPGQMVRGRPVKVNLNTKRGRSGDRHKRRLPTIVYDGGCRVCEFPTPRVKDAFAFDRWSQQDAEAHWTAPFEEHRRLYVGGLPRIPYQDAVNAEMRRLFQGWNVEAVSKIISPHQSMHRRPGSHFYCFVDLPNPQDALDAIEALDGQATPYGGTYRVQLTYPKRPIKVQREQLGMHDSSTPTARPPRNLSGNWRRVDSDPRTRE